MWSSDPVYVPFSCVTLGGCNLPVLHFLNVKNVTRKLTSGVVAKTTEVMQRKGLPRNWASWAPPPCASPAAHSLSTPLSSASPA